MKKCYSLTGTNVPELHFSLVPDSDGDFNEQLHDLFSQMQQLFQEYKLQKRQLAFSKVFLSDYLNEEPILRKHPLFTEQLDNCIMSIIEQPPLDGTKINLLLYFLESENIAIQKKGDYFTLGIDGRKFIYQHISDFESKSPYAQTEEAFTRHCRLLETEGLNLRDHCIRTWIYSRDIDKNYGEIVKARNSIFSLHGLTNDTHFIASTGIEGKGKIPSSAVNIDFLSVTDISPEKIRYLHAPEYLNPTHEYGVAFERATEVDYGDKKHIFISGTASIDKEGDCIFRNDVIKQTERLFLNIHQLLKDGEAEGKNIAQMIVYLRNLTDYHLVKDFLDKHFPETPQVIVLARVCRPEWLIEVECIASLSTKREEKSEN
ncbi:MAG: Rid family hydrolase [Dysgonamonadaceae bacterium]